MHKARAGGIVCRALGLDYSTDLAKVNLRGHLRRKLGRMPRHRDLFEILGGIRQEIGSGGISMEMVDQILTAQDLARYLERFE